MKDTCLFFVGLVLIFFAFSTSVDAEEIRISAAASLNDAVKEIVAEYRKDHPEVELLLNFASSGALAKQISAGAPADIYISANPKWMQQNGTPEIYCQVRHDLIALNRVPSSDDSSIEIDAVWIPDRYTEDTDKVYLRDNYKWAAVSFAVSEFYASRGDAKNAIIHFNEYLQLIGEAAIYPYQAERQRQFQTEKVGAIEDELAD